MEYLGTRKGLNSYLQDPVVESEICVPIAPSVVASQQHRGSNDSLAQVERAAQTLAS